MRGIIMTEDSFVLIPASVELVKVTCHKIDNFPSDRAETGDR